MFSTGARKKLRFRLTTALAATAVALTIVATTFTPEANAGSRERAILGGVAVGIIGTAIVANEIRRNRESGRHDDYHQSRWERHVERCYRAYRSYDEETDTYIDHRGRERVCRK